MKALPRVRPDKSVSVRFADESAVRLSETDVTLTAEGRDRGAMARRFASAVARIMSWVDIGARPAWPFARTPEIGDLLAITYDRLRDTIAARLAKRNALFHYPEPDVRSRAIDLLTMSYRTSHLVADRLPDGEAVLILAPECALKMRDEPKAAVDRLLSLKLTHGNLSAVILRNDKPPTLTNLSDLVTLYENKILPEKAAQAQPSSSPVPKHEAAALTAIRDADEGASPATSLRSEPDTQADISEDDDSYRMGM